MLNEFRLDKYLGKDEKMHIILPEKETEGFEAVCNTVKGALEHEWEDYDDVLKNKKLQREKMAIMGHEEEMGYYKERIKEILLEKKLEKGDYP